MASISLEFSFCLQSPDKTLLTVCLTANFWKLNGCGKELRSEHSVYKCTIITFFSVGGPPHNCAWCLPVQRSSVSFPQNKAPSSCQDGARIRGKDLVGANCFLSIPSIDLAIVSCIFSTPSRSIWCHWFLSLLGVPQHKADCFLPFAAAGLEVCLLSLQSYSPPIYLLSSPQPFGLLSSSPILACKFMQLKKNSLLEI